MVVLAAIFGLVANTPPEPPLHERSSGTLLNDLCIELRYLASGDGSLLNGHGLERISEVVGIYQELSKRGAHIQPRLLELSEQTEWNMPTLLEDCLRYPAVIPLVRESDGIRRALRCQLCSKVERPVDAKVFWFCNPCMEKVAAAVHERTPLPETILFRTYNPEARCEHADDDTVLVYFNHYVSIEGVCEQCIRDELNRRNNR